MTQKEADRIIKRLQDTFSIPSLSAAFYVDGRILTCASGCDENTLFAIGSCTKSFTAGTLLALQDRGLISVDNPAADRISGFALSVPEAARLLTVRDILSHSTGFPGCDLAWYSHHDSFTREDLKKAISLLPMTAKPGERHQYNNMIFSLSGEIIEAVSGMSWSDAVRAYLMQPLEIEAAAFSPQEAMRFGSVAVPYIQSDGGCTKVPHASLGAVSPAGGLYMTAGELLKWDMAILHEGNYRGRQVLSASSATELISPVIPDSCNDMPPEAAAALHSRGYALGMQSEIFRGEKLLFHGGSIDGFLANQCILPGRSCAAVLLTNLGGTFAREAFQYAFSGLMLGDSTDWIEIFGRRYRLLKENNIQSGRSLAPEDLINPEILSGRYINPLFGELVIFSESGSCLARIGSLTLSVKLKKDNFSLFHPEFGDLEAEINYGSAGSVSSLMIAAEPSVTERFEFKKL